MTVAAVPQSARQLYYWRLHSRYGYHYRRAASRHAFIILLILEVRHISGVHSPGHLALPEMLMTREKALNQYISRYLKATYIRMISITAMLIDGCKAEGGRR